ncbi:MAG: IS5 family transposase [Chloroflexi bacterium]|nr:IS5 family transposase [Chloroflexota bacterium]
MPVLPASLFDPLWVQFSALLPERARVAPTHPLGCHRERISDRLVFEHVIAALVHGSGYERIAPPGCSDRTIRRRLREWAELGLAERVHHLALEAYDRMIGLDLEDLAVDGCITKAPSGGEVTQRVPGRSPVDRGKQGLKRSVLTEGGGLPLHLVPAGANRHDAPLLAATLAGLEEVAALTDAEPGTVHLDRGYDGMPTRALLDELGLEGDIARKGVPAPRQAGSRSTVERTHSWMNGYGKLRRCTEKRRVVVEFYLFLAAALIVIRRLIQEARPRYRWPGRPTTRRLT